MRRMQKAAAYASALALALALATPALAAPIGGAATGAPAVYDGHPTHHDTSGGGGHDNGDNGDNGVSAHADANAVAIADNETNVTVVVINVVEGGGGPPGQGLENLTATP